MAPDAQPPTAAELGLMRGCRPAPDKLVTLANWQDPPFNRWAFQHVRELVPSVRIPCGDGPVSELPRQPRAMGGLRFVSTRGKTTTLADMLAATFTDAVLVLHGGRNVLEEYFNDMSASTPHLLQSVSKSITGTLVGILVERGELDAHESITRYVPACWSSTWRAAHRLARFRKNGRTNAARLVRPQASRLGSASDVVAGLGTDRALHSCRRSSPGARRAASEGWHFGRRLTMGTAPCRAREPATGKGA